MKKLLQTLNILFENLRHETSLFYLLSNNHVNSILTGKFDFEDEELLAYYISFLKTLSLRLGTIYKRFSFANYHWFSRTRSLNRHQTLILFIFSSMSIGQISHYLPKLSIFMVTKNQWFVPRSELSHFLFTVYENLHWKDFY